MNYAALVAVLIEGYKGHQERLVAKDARLVEQEEVIAGYQSRVEDLEQRQVVQQEQLAELATLRAQVAAIERLLVDSQPVLTRR